MEEFPNDWSTALAVVAHPDDMEYGAAAAVAKWVGEGKAVAYVMLTSGERGIDGMEPAVCGPLREEEEVASAALVGVTDVHFLRHPDFVLENTVEVRADLAGLVRRYRPELVLTLNFRDTWPGGEGVNTPDHVNTGQAILDTVAETGGVRWVAAAASPRATHIVDVTGHEDTALASLRAHAEYLRGLGPDDRSEEMVLGMMRDAGARAGTGAAVEFEVVEVS